MAWTRLKVLIERCSNTHHSRTHIYITHIYIYIHIYYIQRRIYIYIYKYRHTNILVVIHMIYVINYNLVAKFSIETRSLGFWSLLQFAVNKKWLSSWEAKVHQFDLRKVMGFFHFAGIRIQTPIWNDTNIKTSKILNKLWNCSEHALNFRKSSTNIIRDWF